MSAKRAGTRAAALSLFPLLVLAMRAAPAASSVPSAANSPAPSASPAPAPVAVGSLKAIRVSCKEPECTVATWLLGDAIRHADIAFLVRNDGSAPATLASVLIRATGDRSGAELGEAELAPQPAGTIPPDGLGEVRFQLAADVAPDHYTGQVVVEAPGADKPVSADVDLTIRQGPFIPVALLLAGGLAAVGLRLLRQRWLPVGDLALRIEIARRRQNLLQLSSQEHVWISNWLDTAALVLRARDLTTATTTVDAVEEAVGLFELFLALLVSLGTRTDAGAQSARNLVGLGRAAVVPGKNGAPDLDAARQAYNEATVAALRDPAQPNVSAEAMGVPALQPSTAGSLSPTARPTRPAQELISTRLRLLILRAGLVRLLLALVALAVGLLTLYVAPSAGYIGGSAADSAALLLWGLGSGWVDKVVFDWG
jgi:hypothetical protein